MQVLAKPRSCVITAFISDGLLICNENALKELGVVDKDTSQVRT